MEAKDIVALVFSTLAFLISSLTFLYTVFTGPRLRLLVGNVMEINYRQDFELVLNTDISIFNEGAQSGGLVEFLGTISASDESKKADLRWTRFFESKNVGEPRKPEPALTFAGRPQTIIILGRQAVNKGIVIETKEPFKLSEGIYKLEIWGVVGPKLRKSRKAKGELEISLSNEEYLYNSCRPVPNTSEIKTLSFFRKEQPNRFLNSSSSRWAR